MVPDFAMIGGRKEEQTATIDVAGDGGLKRAEALKDLINNLGIEGGIGHRNVLVRTKMDKTLTAFLKLGGRWWPAVAGVRYLCHFFLYRFSQTLTLSRMWLSAGCLPHLSWHQFISRAVASLSVIFLDRFPPHR